MHQPVVNLLVPVGLLFGLGGKALAIARQQRLALGLIEPQMLPQFFDFRSLKVVDGKLKLLFQPNLAVGHGAPVFGSRAHTMS